VKTLVLLSGGVTPQGRDYLRQNDWLPILAAASHDDGNAVETARWTLGWSRNPANRLLEYKAAGHGTDMFPVEQELVPAIVNWFDAHLRNAPAQPVATSGRPPATPVEEFWTALEQPGGIARAKDIYQRARRGGSRVVLFPEGEMNLYGYQLLQEGKAADAVDVFKLNVDAYPQSANVYDSLSDAYLEAGNRAEALRLAEKALEMLAGDTKVTDQLRTAIRESAEKKIRELRAVKRP
jgi:tetratricopeptide (TPR) repeat protein